jgi:hypothetical protein
VSSETFTRSSPAVASSSALSASDSALVVSDSSGRGRRPTSLPIRPATPARTSGSPPVSRIVRTPRSTKMPASRRISSSVRTAWAGNQANPSAGMQ